MRNMVRFEHCASHHLVLVAHTYHSSTSRYTYLTAVRRACPPTRHSSHFTWITSGLHANYHKWYFAAQLDLHDAVGTQNPGLQRLRSKWGDGRNHSEKPLASALERWPQTMNDMSQYDRMNQIALYFLCWGESAQVRFVPACLSFIFKCADDYYRSPECQNCVDPVSEGLYLRAVIIPIKPLYCFIRDQAMSPLMESLCGENMTMIASLVTMM